jgi:carboxyl-terminal processing protease
LSLVSRASHVACFVAGAGIATALVSFAGSDPPQKPDPRYQSLDSFAQVLHDVSSDYVDPVDEQKLLWAASQGMMSELDVHSTFLPPRRYERMRQDTEGAFGGIGLTLGPGGADDQMPDAQAWPIVDEVVPGSPADKAGFLIDDRIVSIDGEPTVDGGKAMHDASVYEARTRGGSGTRVTIEVLRVGWKTPKAISMVREQVKMPSVQSTPIEKGIGYISISHFQEATHDDTLAALQTLQRDGALDVLILDLRQNPGGLLDQGIRTADLFIDSGTIVTIRGRQGSVETHVAHAADTWSKPKIIVIVDAQTASAAEILSGALQDHKRATILGLPTYGKGSVQTFYDLPDGSGLKLTTARYFTPSGRSLEGTGITPDVVVDTFAPEEITAGGNGGSSSPAPVFDPDVATAGAPPGRDARILEQLADDNQFQAAYQTARGWLGSK